MRGRQEDQVERWRGGWMGRKRFCAYIVGSFLGSIEGGEERRGTGV